MLFCLPVKKTIIMHGDNETAQQGIYMLINGSTALKYGREGKPHATHFLLTADRACLTWKGRSGSVVGKFAASRRSRSVELKRVAHFLVGRESAVFKRFQDDRQRRSSLGSNWGDDCLEDNLEEQQRKTKAPGKEHLSLSLQFERGPHTKDGRDTLDLSFEDEETFGLWVAALRTLLPPHALGHDQRGRIMAGTLSSQPSQDYSLPAPSTPVAAASVPQLPSSGLGASRGTVRPTSVARAEMASMFEGVGGSPSVAAADPFATLGSAPNVSSPGNLLGAPPISNPFASFDDNPFGGPPSRPPNVLARDPFGGLDDPFASPTAPNDPFAIPAMDPPAGMPSGASGDLGLTAPPTMFPSTTAIPSMGAPASFHLNQPPAAMSHGFGVGCGGAGGCGMPSGAAVPYGGGMLTIDGTCSSVPMGAGHAAAGGGLGVGGLYGVAPAPNPFGLAPPMASGQPRLSPAAPRSPAATAPLPFDDPFKALNIS